MAAISRLTLDRYTAALNAISAAAKRKLGRAIERIDLESPDACDLVKAAFAEAMPGYAIAAAKLAAAFYDALREQQVGLDGFASEVETGGSMSATDAAVNGVFANAKTADGISRGLYSRIGYEVARAAGECTMANARRDPMHPRFARVPSGAETCAFCLMLASRGFAYWTKDSAGADGHYHDGCDCRIVPGWDGAEVEGYDPDALYRQWKDGRK